MDLLKLLFKNKIIFVVILMIITLIIAAIYYKDAVIDFNEPKYIVCFPRGGLVYMIHRIQAAYNYAVDYNRVLIIDSRKNWFNDSFYNYFFIHSHNVYVGDIDFLYNSLQPLSMYPEKVNLKTMNVDVPTENSGSLRKFNIDLRRPYQEKIVIYSHYGGGSSVKQFFSICSLTPLVLSAYSAARDKLPASYIAVHIRNTDYKSDVDTFLLKHRDLLKDKPVFVASDNIKTIDKFKKEFNVFTFSDIPENYGKNIHEDYNRTGDEIRKYNVDTIVDLLLLASSSELYYSYADSAFTQAAIELHEDPALLKRLLTHGPNIT